MNNPLAREFGFFSLLKFAFPTVIMMVCMSLYTIVDGIFVSRFVGTNALSAVNIVFPIIELTTGVAIMLATGGSALIARRLGEGKEHQARETFTMLVLTGLGVGVTVAVLGNLFRDPLVRFLGASEVLLADCHTYLSILLFFCPAFVLQILFQSYFVADGHPGLGLGLTIGAGLTNIALDYLFIVPMKMGVAGAALATATGYMIPAVFGLIYFSRKKGNLFFVRPRFNGKDLRESCFNGSSEMVTSMSSGIITFCYNYLMMKLLGEDGVAAITIVQYSQFLLTALYLGFTQGISPVVSFNYGSGNHPQLKKIFRISIIFVVASSIGTLLFAQAAAPLIVGIFAGPGSHVYEIARSGFALFAVSYLFSGMNIFSSGLFTALSDGKTSAAISFLRTFLFIAPCLFLLPKFIGVNGVWLAVPLAELLTLTVSSALLVWGRKRYHYG